YAESDQLEDAVAECERGLEINPSCSGLVAEMGAYLAALGRSEEAIEARRLALKLNPRDPSNFWRHFNIALAQFVAMDYEAAFQGSRKVARSRPHMQSAIVWAASAAALGKDEEARMAVEECLAQRPDLRIATIMRDFILFARAEDRERL